MNPIEKIRTSRTMEVNDEEYQIIMFLRELAPFSKLEISANQNASQLSVYLTRVEKLVIHRGLL